MDSRRDPTHKPQPVRRPLGLGLPLALIGVGLVLATVFHWFRTDEVQAAMVASPAPIDGKRAYKYLTQLCEIGPRSAGSPANARQREMVSKHFTEMGAKVREQPFTGNDPKTQQPLNMVNLIGSWEPNRTRRIVIGAHYDTRPFPDEDPDSAKRKVPFIGANDGASGVALLMEIAHHLSKLPTPFGVDLVLFDGEEIVYSQGQFQLGEYFLGSKEFARLYADGVDSKELPYRYSAGIVLDMVGDRDLKIDQEEYSLNLAPGLVREVWAVARSLKATAFRQRKGTAVSDDHLPLNNAGIPTIDIIDFDYPHWHTSEDLPDKCSAASLEQVGRVVTAWLAQPRKKTR
ncbi:MAG: M28 family peptidase [Isosphaeraceae bacterium]